MKEEEWWLTAAISDDTLVAQLLLHLKQTTTTTVIIKLPPSWPLRQPRSSLCKNRNTPPRLSPTTPLSFSPSREDSMSDRFRSKICVSAGAPTPTPAPTTTTSSKRPRRKKTFVELKEEVSSLLKERTYLKKELATVHLTLKEQKSMNVNLKRIKLDIHTESGIKSEANSTELEEHTTNQSGGASEAASSNESKQVKIEDASDSDSGPPHISLEDAGFVLPDLNMMPDEECGQEVLVGVIS